jgi:hypothetical protein
MHRVFYIAIPCVPVLWLGVQLVRKVGRSFLARRGPAQETARAVRPSTTGHRFNGRSTLAGIVTQEAIDRKLMAGAEALHDDY